MSVKLGSVVHEIFISNCQLIGEFDLIIGVRFLEKSLQVLISVGFLKLCLEPLSWIDCDMNTSLSLLAVVPHLCRVAGFTQG
jgi:hypothetical protein